MFKFGARSLTNVIKRSTKSTTSRLETQFIRQSQPLSSKSTQHPVQPHKKSFTSLPKEEKPPQPTTSASNKPPTTTKPPINTPPQPKPTTTVPIKPPSGGSTTATTATKAAPTATTTSEAKPIQLSSIPSQPIPKTPSNVINPAAAAAVTDATVNSVAKEVVGGGRKKPRGFFVGVRRYLRIAFVGLLAFKSLESPGWERSGNFWLRAFPIYLHYQLVIAWLDFREYLTKLLIKYDIEHYGPILEELGWDSNGQPKQQLIEIVNIDNAGNTETTIVSTQATNAVDNSAPQSPITIWADQKAQADLAYIEKIHQLINGDDKKQAPTSTHTNSNTEDVVTSVDPAYQVNRPVDIQDANNVNKLDRLFANFNSIAEELRDSPEMRRLKKRFESIRQQNLELELLQRELPLLAQDTIAFKVHLPQSFNQFAYGVKTQFKLLWGAIEDATPEPVKQQLGTTFDWLKVNTEKYIVANGIRAAAPYLRQYALPLEPTQKKQHRDESFEPLNAMYSTDIYDIIAKLRGYFIKIGQLGSMRADMLPKEWITELKKFQNDCPSVPFQELIPMIESEIGPLSNHFEYVNPIPLGAASIGQVHLAKLKNGQNVVIKIQYPDVEQTFLTDMSTIRTFCELAQPEQLPQLDEVEKAFMSEFNFAREAVQLHFAERDLQFAREHGANGLENPNDELSEFAKYVKIPTPIPELCTKHVLVMEQLHGSRLATFLEKTAQTMASEQGLTYEQFLEKYGEAPPPSTEEIQQYRLMASNYDYYTNLGKKIYNYTLGWFTPNYEYTKTTVPVDIRRIVKYVYQAHGHQVFNGHCFNSDSHPGNILFDPNAETDLDGMIGLIDYGQVKSLPLYYRALLAHVMIALEERDWKRVADLTFFSGYRSTHNFQQETVEQLVLGFDYDDNETRRGMNIETYFTTISALDKPIQIQEKLALAGQTTFFLRALPQYLHFTVRASEMWAPYGREFLKQHPILDHLVRQGLDEFSQLYQEELISAKSRALRDLGTDEEYFVDLSRAWAIQHWCEAVGELYGKKYYDEIFTNPLPMSLIDYNADPKNKENEASKLRGKKLIAITHADDINEFIPKEGQFEFNLTTPGVKPYDFFASKPEFIKNLPQTYRPPTKHTV